MVRYTNNSKDFVELCKEIRKDILRASFEAQACHIGSALSCVEILVDIYWNKIRYDEHEGYVAPRDIFVFSKASGAVALYSVLAKKGYFSKDKIAYYLKNYPLPTKDVPGVQVSVGSLGHGLPIAVGMAYADGNRDVYILMSDGECQEGTTWESILFARQYNLTNLHIIIDRNGLQACGRTEDIIGLEDALFLLKQLFPIEIVKTTKGKGVKWMENKVESHYCNINKEQMEEACKTLDHIS